MRPILALLLLWSLVLRLVFALPGLDEPRFWDETYSLENVEHALDSGRLEPVSGWYPVPSWTPHALALGVAERALQLSGRSPEVLRTAEGVTPAGRYLCRAFSAFFGTLSLWLTFLLGRRLFGDGVALLGTALLSAAEIHLRLSAAFKPDLLLMALGLAAILVSLRAAASGGWHRFVLAGVLVALAASAKLNGVLFAASLPVATLARSPRDRSGWRGLLLAGLASVGLFFLLNPWWRLYLDYFERTRYQYLETAVGLGETRFGAVGRVIGLLVSQTFHGGLIGVLSVAGLLALGVTTLRRRPENWFERAGFLAFPLVYFVVFVAMTPRAKPNHVLQLLPFTSLAAAWLAVVAMRGLWKGRSSRLGGSLLGALVLVVTVAPTLTVYRSVVPATSELASRQLRELLAPLELVQLCQLFDETRSLPGLEVVAAPDRAVVVTPGVAGEEACVELSDALVFDQDRAPGGVQESPDLWIRARPPAGRGEPLAVRVQRWHMARDWIVPLHSRATGDGLRLHGDWPAEIQGQVVSVVVRIPRAAIEGARLTVDDFERSLVSTRRRGARDRLVTPRWRASPGQSVAIELPLASLEEAPRFLRVVAWQRQDPGAGGRR